MEPGASFTNVVVLGATGSVGRQRTGRHRARRLGPSQAPGLGPGCPFALGAAGGASAAPPAPVHYPDRSGGGGLRQRPVARYRRRGPLRARTGWSAMVEDPETDRVLSAIVGAAGPARDLGGVEAGKIVALANKETLVVAGPLVMDLARRRGATILPVDSEHSAIYPGPPGGRAQGGAAGDPDLVRAVRSGAARAASWPTSPPRRRCGTRPGGWGRRSRSTRPRS